MKDKPMENEVDVDAILALAALIRKVDGKHSLGAAALAEALLGHPDFLKVVALIKHTPHLNLLNRVERFATDHVDPDPLVQAKFLSLVCALIEGGIESGRDAV